MMRAPKLWSFSAAASLLVLSACQFPSYSDSQIASLYGGKYPVANVPVLTHDDSAKDKNAGKEIPAKPVMPEPGKGKDTPIQAGFPPASAPYPIPYPSLHPTDPTDPTDHGDFPGVAVGEPCIHSARQGQLCLGLKYVVYQVPGGDPIETDRDAADNVREVNHLWSDCGIQFQIDRYIPVEPSQMRLRFRTANHSELNDIRRKFVDESTLLVVTTGSWDRRGTLGGSWANAWTNLPGEGIYGSILEQSVSRNSNVLAHELGHYLSLDHVSDSTSLMNPVIYPNSTRLTRRQCESARWAAGYFWKKMAHGESDSESSLR